MCIRDRSRFMSDASISADESTLCPSLVEGIVPSSWPVMLSARFKQNCFSAAAPVTNSS